MTSFLGDTSGGVGIMLGIILPVVAAAVGGAVDYSNAIAKRTDLQQALDQAAFAVALAPGDDAARKKAGAGSLEANFSSVCGAEPDFVIAEGEITGTVTCDVGTYILGIVGIDTIPVSVSTAIGVGGSGGGAAGGAGPTCLYVMHPTAGSSFEKGGGGSFDAPGCGIHVNSSSAVAMSVGAGSVDVQAITVVGGANASCMATRCKTTPVLGSAPKEDYVAPPSQPCTQTNYDDKQAGNRTITGGVYCGGMDFAAGDTHFEPGLYVIRDGLLQQGGGGNWTGEGVTFRFEGTGRLSRGGGGNVSFSAPTSGDYAGLLFLQAPSSQVGLEHDFGGGSTKRLEGLIYLPDHDMNFGGGGNAASMAPWTIWVVRQMNLGGGGNVNLGASFDKSEVPLPEAFVDADVGVGRLKLVIKR